MTGERPERHAGTPAPARSRIAIVGPAHPYKGGVAQHTTELAHRLAACGHDVRLESWSAQYPARLYPGRQRVDAPETRPFPATSYPLSWRRPDTWPRLGRRLRTGVDAVDAVVVVVVTPIQAPAYLGVLAGLRPPAPRPGNAPAGGGRGSAPAGGVPAENGRAVRVGRGLPTIGGREDRPVVLALCHNVLPHERRALDVPLVRAVLRRVSGVLVHTPAEAERARGLTTRPVWVAPMAPHLGAAGGAVSDRTRDGAAGRTRDGAAGGRRLLFFGLVRPYKGLDVLLRALAAGPPDVRLTVAGEFWGGVDDTRRLVGELGLAGRVELRPGYVPAAEVPALFTAADALVLPYRSATATQNVDLAHRHGLPVVATAVGMLGQAVRDGVDGLLAAPDDPGSLAAALRRLYEPGVLDTLRAGIVPPDADAAWERYLTVLHEALGRR
ncbi:MULTISPECIES: glycosyltransferase [unclassified Frankia]|uniref:glycosyltransferase n=1 Tax=unclassified Frankia TaxID=2632575 RepID=UPI002024F463